MLFSASSLAAAGAGGILRSSIGAFAGDRRRSLSAASLVVEAPAAPAACATASGLALPASARRLRGRLGGACACPQIVPSSAPTPTVSPSLAVISDSVPAAGAGTSIVTLSVSSSTSGSSAAIASPTFLNHLPMVASVTDSPRVGTRISVAICFLSRFPLVSTWIIRRARRRGKPRAAPDASTSGRSPARPPPGGRYSARAGAWRRYGRAPIPDTDR